MRKLGYRLFLAAAFPFAVGAVAADLPPAEVVKANQGAPAPRLSCHMGVFAEGIVSHPELFNVPAAGVITEYTVFGGRGGGLIGCDIRFATRTFLGLEAAAAYGWLNGKFEANTFQSNVPFEATARVRLGYMLHPQLGAYIAGGPSVGYLDAKDGVGITESELIWGGHAAIGLQFELAPNWQLRGEYAYTYYGPGMVVITGFPFSRVNPTTHAVRLGIVGVFSSN